jgi:HK97 family phage portal protein
VSLFGLFERRSLESPAQPLTSAALIEALGGAISDAGVAVNERTALAMPAVWRAVSVIAGVSSALPMATYRAGTKNATTAPLLADPHPELTPSDLWRLSFTHRALWGNSYTQKVRSGAGQVKELWPVSPDRVKVERIKPVPGNPGGKLFHVDDDWGTHWILTSRDIMHIPGLGYDGITGCSPIRAAQSGVGLALAAEKAAARLFGSGNLIGGVLQTEQRLDPEKADQLKARWKAKVSGYQNSHEIAVLDSGAAFHPVAMPNKDAQFLESREFQVVEIARMFGVPLFLLMETAKSTSWGTGLEQQALGWVTFDLGPMWLTPTEQRVTKELLPANEYASYRLTKLLRGDSAARATFYRAMRDVGAWSANDILDHEDMPPLPGPEGDLRLQPLYMAPLGTNPLAGADSGPADSSRAARAAALMAEAHRLLITPDETDPAQEGTP